MDTRLKKTNKVKIFIIALCVMLPAFILVALHPRLEKSMLASMEEKNTREVVYSDDEKEWEISDSFVNYAMEASYYLYGQMLQELTKKQLDFSVLEENGWVNDFYRIHENTEYEAVYTGVSGEIKRDNTARELEAIFEDSDEKEALIEELYNDGILAYLVLEFNTYGQITNVEMQGRNDVDFYTYNLYSRTQDSVAQYKNNAAYHEEITFETEERSNEDNFAPKNFKVAFLVKEGSEFATGLYSEDEENYTNSYVYAWEETVAISLLWLIMILAALVAAAALLLPFVKKLDTGWEKIFCMPLEIIAALALIGFLCAIGMYVLMFYWTKSELGLLVNERGMINILGFELRVKTVYGLALVGAFWGWAGCFFADYIVFAAFRQFLCSPMQYVKKRFLCGKIIGKFVRWCKRKMKQFYVYVTDIKIGEKLNQSIIKILVVDCTFGAILLFLVASRFLGVFGDGGESLLFGLLLLIAYHAWLYVMMRRLGEKTQKQYDAIYDAAHEMANGNLKISLKEEKLGIMEPIGKELEKVQEGFSKAVQKEAQSQNMKTELITNVSHDLKTPLTAIITYVDLLKKEEITEEERRSYVKTLDQKSQRLKILIEDLFEVSKANSGNIKMNFMEVDVVSLMKQVRLEMEDKIAASNLVFRWNFPEEKIILSLDGQRTYRVFENLLNNILKYSMPNSRVYIDIEEHDLEVQIIFKNMSAAELDFDAERLTERFVRGDASRKTEGSGLGLAIVKSFVELQNGKVDVSVDGDLFKVTLSWRK